MVFIAGNFSADEILCNLPPHTLRIDLQARRWKSDVDPDNAIVDGNDNGIPIEFILLGFTPFFGNLGLRNGEEFIRMAFIGVTPKHRLLPPRCLTVSMISGKSSQKNFIAYFQNLYNNRINCASAVTSSKFVTRSFNERDPLTGADGNKINFNTLEFKDRPAADDNEKKLIEDVNDWLEGTGGTTISSALRSHVPGADLIELPLGSDHAALKAEFIDSRGQQAISAAPTPRTLPASVESEEAAETAPPAPTRKKKSVELSEEQAKSLGIDF